MALRTARRRAVHTFADLGGGLNLEGADYLVEGSQARDLLNLEPEGNAFKRRRPHRDLGITTLAWALQYAYMIAMPYPSVTKLALVGGDGSGNTDFREINPSTGTVTDRSGAFAFADEQYVMFIGPTSGGQGPLYAISTLGNPFYWTGAAANIAAWTASAGSIPQARFGIYHANRVWLTQGRTVSWSSLSPTGAGDPRNWSSTAPNDAGSVDIGSAGDEITGIGTVGNAVLVFMANSTWLIYDTNTGANRQVSDRIGTPAHRSIAPSPHGTFFVGADGVYVTDGNSVREVSQAISPMFQGVAGFPQVEDQAAFFHEDGLLITVRDMANGHAFLMQYHVPSKTWWKHTLEPDEAYGAPSSLTLLAGNLYALGGLYSESAPGRVYQVFDDDATDDAAAASWTGPWHALGNPTLDKRVHEVRLDCDGAVTLQLQRYPTDSFTSQTETAWETAGTATTERRFYTPGQGRLWSVKIASTAPDFRMGSYVFDATQRVS